jgi:acetoin utilization protein AcuB
MLSDRDVKRAIGSPLSVLVPGRRSRRALMQLRVDDVMTAAPLTITEDVGVAEVAQLLADRRFGAVPVVDQEQRALGIISYVDLLRVLVMLASP